VDDLRNYLDRLNQSSPVAEKDLRDKTLPIPRPYLLYALSRPFVRLPTGWQDVEKYVI